MGPGDLLLLTGRALGHATAGLRHAASYRAITTDYGVGATTGGRFDGGLSVCLCVCERDIILHGHGFSLSNNNGVEGSIFLILIYCTVVY